MNCPICGEGLDNHNRYTLEMCCLMKLIEENKRLKEALTKIATKKMSMYLDSGHMNRDFINIANEALK